MHVPVARAEVNRERYHRVVAYLYTLDSMEMQKLLRGRAGAPRDGFSPEEALARHMTPSETIYGNASVTIAKGFSAWDVYATAGAGVVVQVPFTALYKWKDMVQYDTFSDAMAALESCQGAFPLSPSDAQGVAYLLTGSAEGTLPQPVPFLDYEIGRARVTNAPTRASPGTFFNTAAWSTAEWSAASAGDVQRRREQLMRRNAEAADADRARLAEERQLLADIREDERRERMRLRLRRTPAPEPPPEPEKPVVIAAPWKRKLRL